MAGLQFPLSGQDKYKGRIRFDVYKTIPPTISSRAQAAVRDALSSADARLGGNPAGQSPLDPNDPRGPNQIPSLDDPSVGIGTEAFVGAAREVRTGNMCSLYLPQSIQIQDGVQIENMDLGVFGSSLEAGMRAGTSPVEAMVNATGATFGSIGDFFRGNLTQDAARAAAARLSGMASDGALSGAVRSALQTTPAPNTRAIFKSVNIREFSFQFTLLPKSLREAQEIEAIIKFFRTELYPETIKAASIPVAYKFPNKFAISIEYDGQEVATKILKSYLRNFQTNYNPNSMAFFESGHFQEISIAMSFVESRTLDKDDIDGGF
jgi:hypothetical protein